MLNALGNRGSAGLTLNARIHLDGPDPDASTRSQEEFVAPKITVTRAPSKTELNTVTVQLSAGAPLLVLQETFASSGVFRQVQHDGTVIVIAD